MEGGGGLTSAKYSHAMLLMVAMERGGGCLTGAGRIFSLAVDACLGRSGDY